ncbi:NAD(P)/FAD-dependent oxidoreductase [Motiliproteus coralliicola]|nr:NAD(P)/FAD-dependent oxidoreductase [Motiliproteus coralliicola]
MNSYDIAIIGAGPAGMSAAITASQAGARVVVLDDKPRAGGQIYRNVSVSPLTQPEQLGPDYLRGAELVEAFERCSAEKRYGATVWHVGDNGEVLFSQQEQTHSLTARELMVGCGAMERPFPIPGWHLPGVMSAGSAQVMLKSDALVQDNAVFAGSGPLLYLIVAQYLRLGVKVKALVDTTPKSNYLAAMGQGLGLLSQPAMLVKGLGLLNEIRQAGVPVHRFAQNLEVIGDERVSGLRWLNDKGSEQINCEHLFLHQGVIPNLNMTRSLNLKHHWCEQQLCWKPSLDSWGQSSIASISVAGDSSGIVGADGAERMGRLVALNQLARLGRISLDERDQRARGDQEQLASLNRFRRFIDRLYQPIEQHRIPEKAETVVCRCEERNLGQLRTEFERGARGPNELKMMSRCGMGPCQGRQCGHTVSELLASWRGERVDEVGYYRLRSPMRLLNLTELGRFSRVEPATTNTNASADPVSIQEPSQ